MSEKKRIGIALTGSFCTFSKVLECLAPLAERYDLLPIMSDAAYSTDTRFGTAEDFRKSLSALCGKPIRHTSAEAEPIGPKNLIDALVIAPCTANTLGKLALGITDSAPTMAAKSTLRNGRPVILGLSTNDALGGSARNIGALQSMRGFYFIPYGQDDPIKKPRSCIANFNRMEATIEAALKGEQLQPMLDR